MPDCIFCKIANSEIPSSKVFENDKFFVFLDIAPLNPGHCLVVPKSHYRWVYDVPEFGQYWEIANKITHAILRSKLNPKFISYITVGNQVPHAHIHIVPRYENDQHKEGIDATKRLKTSQEELKLIQSQIIEAL